MSNAKTGGNKKSSSPSDEGYWKRAQASKYAETHKERRIARHIKRCKTSKTKLSASNGLMAHINFPTWASLVRLSASPSSRTCPSIASSTSTTTSSTAPSSASWKAAYWMSCV